MQSASQSIFRKRVLPCVILLGLCGFSAQATIPLVLKETIQLPPGGVQDVQHVLDDSTFGWAQLSGDTIRYKLTESDSIHRLTIPAGVYGMNIQRHTNHFVRLLRMSSADGHMCVMLFAKACADCGLDFYSESNVLCFFDLVTGTCVDTVFSPGGYGDTMGSHYYDWTNMFRLFYPWPPLPDTSSRMFYVGAASGDGYNPGGQYYGDYNGNGWLLDFEDSMRVTSLGPWDNLQPFVGSVQPDFALSGSVSEWDQYDEDPRTGSGQCYIGTYTSSYGARRDSLHGCVTIVGQMDADGTRRMIYAGAALDPDSFAQLWANPAIPGTLYTARLAGNHNERVLGLGSHIFSVFDAADGSFIDWTSTFWGTMQTVLKSSNGPSEIITFDAAASLIRVYVAALPPARSLTMSYIPETGSIRLRWPRVEAVAGYNIYAAGSVMGTYTLLAQVSPATLTFDLPLTGSRRFFFVTDLYDNP